MSDEETFELPPDLTLLSDDEVFALEERATAAFDRAGAVEEVTPELVEQQSRLSDDIDSIRVEVAARHARNAESVQRAQAKLLNDRERLSERVHGPAAPVDAPPAAAPAVDVAELATRVGKEVGEAVVASLAASVSDRAKRNLQVREPSRASLAAAAGHAPAVDAGSRNGVTAGVDLPGVATGSKLTSLMDVATAFGKVAARMPATHNGHGAPVLVATIRNTFDHTLDDNSTPRQVDDALRSLTAEKSGNLEALVAGGGWCAPSQIRYDFFNIAGSDGLVDLPTVGISRGGLRFPTSPSLADAVFDVGSTGTANKNLAGFGTVFSALSEPWVWTETDDIATVTGSPNKPTVRVPCPGFNEVRLECYGITLTAGNLTNEAYPEATTNTLRLLNSAWAHAQNARIISQMVAQSSSAITISGGATRPAYNQILSGMDLAATDYRAKFGMTNEEVLEVIAPMWLSNVVRADLAYRKTHDTTLISVSDAQIEGFFRDRFLRVQWVNDWQVRGAGQFGNPAALPGGAMTAWPTVANLLVYAAGTFIKGNGLTLDLGVVRDSVLNAENDFTAAWSEECHLVAKVGHESRNYAVSFAVNGAAVNDQAIGAYL